MNNVERTLVHQAILNAELLARALDAEQLAAEWQQRALAAEKRLEELEPKKAEKEPDEGGK